MLLAVVAALVLVTRADAAPPSTTKYFVTGGGFAVDVAADDGTVATQGTLLGLSARAGQDPRVPYKTFLWFFGTRSDSQYPYIGVAEATVQVSGMDSAHATGTVSAVPLFGVGPAATIDVDITLAGSGAVSATTTTYTSGSPGSAYVNVLSQRSRAAAVTGSIAVDGSTAATANALILGVTQGEFNVVAQPSR